MAREGTSLSFSSAIVQGQKVNTSSKNTIMAASNNSINSSTINVGTEGIAGKTILTACNIDSVGSQNGIAAAASSASLTFTSTYADLTQSFSTGNPRITVTAANGTVRSFNALAETGVGSATWTYSKEHEVNNEITLISLGDDETSTTSKTYKAAAVGTSAGTLDGGDVTFATYDADAGSTADKLYDTATNIAAAINHANGHNGYLEAYANVVSRTDSTAANGKVIVYQTVPGTAGNTAITHTEDGTATATFTFGDIEFNDHNNETITLIDTAGLSKTYVIRNDYGASGALEFNAGANATAAAANFKAVVESSGGHNGTITVGVVAGAVTMTQVAGIAGNTTIAHSGNWDALCDVNVGSAFTGGGGTDLNTSVNVPTAFTGGTAVSRNHTNGEFGRGGSARWAAYDLKTAINNSFAGVPDVTATSNSSGQVTITSDTAGAAGNTIKLSVNDMWDDISAVMPPAFLSGGVDAVTPKMGIEYSIDGTNWSTAETIINDLNVTSTGLRYGTVTIPDNVPYARLVFNTLETTVGTGVKQQLQFVS